MLAMSTPPPSQRACRSPAAEPTAEGGRSERARRPRGAMGSLGSESPQRMSLFDELAKEQRSSMDEQGVRLKLGRQLGAGELRAAISSTKNSTGAIKRS